MNYVCAKSTHNKISKGKRSDGDERERNLTNKNIHNVLPRQINKKTTTHIENLNLTKKKILM